MAGDQEDFCENYLLLKPEEASCLDFVRLLCSKNLENKKFCDTRGVIYTFRHRWIVFISLLLQKVLIYLDKPLAAVGTALEMVLNLPGANGGFLRLLLNILTGRVVKPDETSAEFVSVVGKLEKRLDLDKNIKKESSKYNASLAIMASKISYENQAFVRNVITNHWQMEFLEFSYFWNDYQEVNKTCATMFQDKTTNLIIVAFRGTEPFDADLFRTDIDISWYEFNGIGKVHGGFMKALGLQKSKGWPKETPTGPTQNLYAYYTIREKLKSLINENGDAKFILTGHSLGGAIAILYVFVLALHEEEMLLRKLEGVYTFGQPRVGNKQFGEYMKGKMMEYNVEYYRYVYCNDIVPRLPYDDRTFLFKHFGPCLYFNSFYKGQVLVEEPNKNYFSMLHFVPKILNATYELIRSFILPWIKGRDYEEGWFMKLFRITALGLTPGLTNHIPTDYVNVTRLGKLPSSIYPQGPNQNLIKQD